MNIVTIKDCLRQLPEQECINALANTPQMLLEEEAESMVDALYSAFNWKQSPQGDEYWAIIAERYE